MQSLEWRSSWFMTVYVVQARYVHRWRIILLMMDPWLITLHARCNCSDNTTKLKRYIAITWTRIMQSCVNTRHAVSGSVIDYMRLNLPHTTMFLVWIMSHFFTCKTALPISYLQISCFSLGRVYQLRAANRFLTLLCCTFMTVLWRYVQEYYQGCLSLYPLDVANGLPLCIPCSSKR